MRRFPSFSLLLIPLLFAGCATEADDEGAAANAAVVVDTEADEAAVGELRQAWETGALAGDAAAVGALYADDAVMVGPDGRPAEGRQAVQDALMFEGLNTLEINSTDTVVGADLASDMGTFSQTFQTPDGEQTVSGNYLVVLERQDDGTWMIVQHFAAVDPGAMAGAGEAADTM